MSRLADVTRLDTIGVPVWQAIRPWNRSISVHQGKGFDAEGAQIGACFEAIECASAEASVPGGGRRASFDALDPAERAPSPGDFASAKGTLNTDDPIDWVPAELVGRSGPLWVPFLAVSLDFCLDGHPGIQRTSNGIGGGFDLAGASLKALCELVERDAFGAWALRPVIDRSLDEIDSDSVDYGWFRDFRAHVRNQGIIVRLFRLPAAIAVPAIAAELLQIGDSSTSRKCAVGTCVHPDPERALRGAVLEAAQARLAEIAGSRDDIDPARPEDMPERMNLALPAPPWAEKPRFHALWPEPAARDPEGQFRRLVEQLAGTGYRQVARIVLSPPTSPAVIARLFAPGLGGLGRPRRAPLH